ncbi:MAG: hypothetical protein RL685_5925 [Pseudomonadota bacterium]|jgi:hypothetical protein
MKGESLLKWMFGAWVLAGLGCSDPATEGALASRSHNLNRNLSLESEPDPEPEPEPDGGAGGDPVACNCIRFPPAAQATCSEERLFCNSSLDCQCVAATPAGAAQSAAAILAPVRTAQRRSRLITEEHGGEELATLPPPPLVCVCLAGTPSAPEGGCPEEDWYCNRSGRCQCDS